MIFLKKKELWVDSQPCQMLFYIKSDYSKLCGLYDDIEYLWIEYVIQSRPSKLFINYNVWWGSTYNYTKE